LQAENFCGCCQNFRAEPRSCHPASIFSGRKNIPGFQKHSKLTKALRAQKLPGSQKLPASKKAFRAQKSFPGSKKLSGSKKRPHLDGAAVFLCDK
jgi:hypothetical protein